MNILLVTTLYPRYQGQSRREVSYALHEFVGQWTKSPDTSVLVVIPEKRIRIRAHRLNVSGTQEHTIDDVPVVSMPLWNMPGYRILSAKPVARYLEAKSFTPDVFLAHMSLGAETAALLGQRFCRPAVFALHHSDLLFPDRIRRLLPAFTAIVFRSESIKQQFRRLFPSSRGSFVAASGIEAREILNEREYLSKTFHNPLRILSVTSLIPLKNIDVVLRALARLPKDVAWTYTVVGDGAERANLESLTNCLGLRERVSFVGERRRSECLEIMSQSDVFVLVSAPETFGLVYLEAMAKGMIVIGAKGTGIDGVVEHGENGFLCPPRNEYELSALLLQILRSDDLLPVRQTAYQTIRQFTVEQRAAAYLNFLSSVSLPARRSGKVAEPSES